ncbi:minor structural protein GP20 [Salsuginibacillus halophilus]|uniref:Minor structural protein GP20 n=1 Tax=Salsuginibacillus halophilus TaxID=517424 RepID=A0A2P8H678_9BACI|nr:phage scaffolding protein [Salsuginibacillus halophilus]PSL41711.1 minor structural protein GP20 [Salsuginibacillus halophilus]
MKREFLKELGLENEAIEKIMEEHGKTVNSIKEEAGNAEELQQQLDEYKQAMDDRDKQLKELNKQAEGNEELQNKIKELQDQNEQTKQEYEQQLQQTKFDHALEKSLTEAEAKNPKAVKALLDMDTIKQDGDVLKGLDDQLSKIRESDPYLFAEQQDQPKPQFGQDTNVKAGESAQDSWLEAFKPAD